MNQNGYVDLDNPDTPEDESELIQENHYYPFGMDQLGNWVATVGPKNDYLYNGKEWNEEVGWYDYGARWYDPAIGRWNAVDPLAEEYYPFSPYNYVLGNPISLIDPDGRSVDDIIVGSQVWTPGATYNGVDDFGKQVFKALNTLYENIEAGDVSTRERTGNVIMDFVGEDAIGDVTIISGEYAPFGEGSVTSEDGTQIFWNTESALHVGPNESGTNIEGDQSTETALAHEFGHAWLAQGSPMLDAGFERVDANDADATNEHNWILKNVETPYAKARGEGQRTKYRGIYKSKEDYKRDASNGYGDYMVPSKNK